MFAFLSGKIPIIKQYEYPIDFKLKFRSKRILGDHKTIRGFIVGILAAIIFTFLQVLMYKNSLFIQAHVPIDYTSIQPLLLGTLLGSGALIGDAVKSFFKRQINISPGKKWFFFDQVDYVLGGLFFSWFYLPLSFFEYITIFILWFFIHLFMSILVYILGFRAEAL